MPRKIAVEITGDSRDLERAFARSSKAAKGFGRTAETTATRVDRSAKRFSGFAAGAFTGFAGSQALTEVTRQVTAAVDAAAESQQVLGQTKVALESTGKSWADYGDQIEQTVAAQSKFGFDDEALLRSFSLFVRGSGSVTEALRRNQLAMDVARGRYISLEQAALIVTKAAMGQSGALRRLGIEARKGASGIELLTLLQSKYGGAAQAANEDAATAMDRFKVSAENAQEALGTLLLPVVSRLADALAVAADDISRLTTLLGQLGGIRLPEINIPLKVSIAGREVDFGAGGQSIGGLIGGAIKRGLTTALPGAQQLGQVNRIFQSLPKEAEKAGAQAGQNLSDQIGYAMRELRGMVQAGPGFTVQQRNTWFDAAIGRREDRVQDIRSAKAQLRELDQIAAAIRARRADTSDITRRLTLEDKLLAVLRRRRAIAAQIAQQARDAAQAAVEHRNQVFDAGLARQLDRIQDLSLRKQLARLKEIAAAIRARIAATKDVTRKLTLEDKLVEVYRQQRDVQQQITDKIKAGNEALKERADAIKAAVLERLQARQARIQNQRDLRDAQEQLRLARRLGGPREVRAARERVADVRFAQRVAGVEAARPTLTRGGRFALAGVVINIHGVTDPEEVARRVTAIIQRRNRRRPKPRQGQGA